MSDNRKFYRRSLLFRALLGIVAIVCLVILSTGILLKTGIELHTISFGRIMLSDFSLIWQDKLELQVGRVAVSKSNDGVTPSEALQISTRGKSVIRHLVKLFSKVSIGEFRVGDFTGTVSLRQDTGPQESFFSLTSEDITFRSTLVFKPGTLVVDIKKAASKRFNSEATGQIRLDIDRELLTGTLSANISGSLPVSLEFSADSEKLSFTGKEAGEIRTITPLIDLFGLSPDVQRWITDYLKSSCYNLQTFNGILTWHNPGAVLDSLYAEVRVDDCQYTFAQGFEPIKTCYTDVIFQKGVLTIIPHEPTFYGQKAEGSNVEIDFSDPANIILTTYVKTDASVNDEIVALLNYYNIPLPFKQTQGYTETNLVLRFNLSTSEVEANGMFLVSEGNFEYKENNIGVENAKIVLNNSNVTIEHVFVRF